MCSKKGYTFIELMVVLALVGLASTIALSDHLAQKPRAQLRQASREMISQLRGIRQQSITTGETRSIYFSNGDGLVQVDGQNIALADNEYMLIPGRVKKTLPSDIRFGYPGEVTRTPRGGSISDGSQDGISFSNDRVSFEPNGTTSGLNGQIYLTNASSNPSDETDHDEAFAIDINVTGQVRLYKLYPEQDPQWQ